MATDYQDCLRIPLEGNDQSRFATSTGLHGATGYTRAVIGQRGPYVEFLPGNLIWDNLHMPDEEKYVQEHPAIEDLAIIGLPDETWARWVMFL